MPQVTIYLTSDEERALKAGARRAKKSLSEYIAERATKRPRKRKKRWSTRFLATLGSWEGDVPEINDPPRASPLSRGMPRSGAAFFQELESLTFDDAAAEHYGTLRAELT